MNKKKLVLFSSFYILFFILLLLANGIILAIPQEGTNSLIYIKNESYSQFPSNVIYRIDSFSKNNDIKHTAEFSGWAFIPGSENNNNKTIKLVFQSTTKKYEVTTDLQDRFDLRSKFYESNVANLQHGFRVKFSTIKMRNGIYKLFLYCYDNENNYGIVDSGETYLKDHRQFIKYEGNL